MKKGESLRRNGELCDSEKGGGRSVRTRAGPGVQNSGALFLPPEKTMGPLALQHIMFSPMVVIGTKVPQTINEIVIRGWEVWMKSWGSEVCVCVEIENSVDFKLGVSHFNSFQ